MRFLLTSKGLYLPLELYSTVVGRFRTSRTRRCHQWQPEASKRKVDLLPCRRCDHGCRLPRAHEAQPPAKMSASCFHVYQNAEGTTSLLLENQAWSVGTKFSPKFICFGGRWFSREIVFAFYKAWGPKRAVGRSQWLSIIGHNMKHSLEPPPQTQGAILPRIDQESK